MIDNEPASPRLPHATSRLRLRAWRPEDHAVLHAILSDRETMRFWPSPFTPEQTQAWIERSLATLAERGYARYAVELAEDATVIGDCGLIRTTCDGDEVNDIGYIIHHPWQGRGYATEASRAVLRHAFETLGLDAVHANMAHDNDRSRHVAVKLGMRHLRRFHNERNRMILTDLFAITRSEWEAAAAAAAESGSPDGEH